MQGLTEVNIGRVERLERCLECGRRVIVVVVVQLGGEEQVLPGDFRGLDSLTDLCLVRVRCSSVNVSVAMRECILDGVLDLAGLRLPCTCDDDEEAFERI